MIATGSLLHVLHATTMSRRAAITAAHADSGCVHSVFRRCFNIKTTEGEWLTIAGAPFPQTPDAIIVDTWEPEIFSKFGVMPHMAVSISSDEISIPDADLFIALTKAEKINTRRAPFQRLAKHHERAERNFFFAREIIRRDGRICDVPEFHRRAEPAVGMLREAILSNDAVAMRAQCERLIGLGIGLTPSGDDILCGIAAGLFLGDATQSGGGKQYLSVLRDLLRDGTRTTDVSARSLQLCVEGEINEIVYAAARAILCEGEYETKHAITALLSQGGTSGTETAQGLCFGLQIAEEFFEIQNLKTTSNILC